MEIETRKLGCSKEQLQELIRALGTRHKVEMRSASRCLTFRTQGSQYSCIGASRGDKRIIIPYSGEERCCYAEAWELNKSVEKEGTVISVETRGKPLGWVDEYHAQKSKPYIPMAVSEMMENLDFLFRLNQDDCPTSHQGVVFNTTEMLTTDTQSIHVSTLSTPLTQGPALCDRGVLMTLRKILDTQFQWSLEGFFHPPLIKKNRNDKGFFLLRLTEPTGLRVELSSVARTTTTDLIKGEDTWLRAPINEHAIIFSVCTAHLHKICSETEGVILTLRPGKEWLEYQSRSTSAKSSPPVDIGSIPVVWSANQHPIQLHLAPNKILTVLKGSVSEYTQFIVPAQPETGFEFYEIEAVYLNTMEGKYAVISQMTCAPDHERMHDLVNMRAARASA